MSKHRAAFCGYHGGMKRSPSVFALVILVLALAPNFGSAQTAAGWPTFHGNAQRNGYTTTSGPTTNAVS
ncbi:MAG: hypothetical protein JOZ41_07590, partial [Chloroflexi bacterium]|nr:hypothetical protein [Chloroflexota bacterium]